MDKLMRAFWCLLRPRRRAQGRKNCSAKTGKRTLRRSPSGGTVWRKASWHALYTKMSEKPKVFCS